ncbi:hypothetical protein Emag_000588 [Eimeria magna]
MAELAEATPPEGSGRHASPECTKHEESQQPREKETNAHSPFKDEYLQGEAWCLAPKDRTGEGKSSTSKLSTHRQFVMNQANVASGDSAAGVQGPSAALEAECPGEICLKDGEQVIKSTAELACAVTAASKASSQTLNTVAAGKGYSTAAPSDSLSDMPPPSLLPRQLRIKRGGISKVASLRPSRIQAATTSGADNALASSSEEASGLCAEQQAYWEQGKMQGEAASSAAALPVSGDTAKADEEFSLFMKEIEQLDSQREAQHAGSQSAESAVAQEQASLNSEQSPPSLDCSLASLSSPETRPLQRAEKEAEQLKEQRDAPRSEWQAVVDSATGKTYYWDVTTDHVTWDMPTERAGQKSVDEAPDDSQVSELQHWAEATFKLTQELPTSGEKVQQLIFQLDFMEEELDAMYEGIASAKPEPAPEELDMSARLQRFRTLKRQREPNRLKRSRETKAACSDDELLKELIDLQLQQGRPQAPWQCPRCKRCNAEPRTQPQQAEIRSLASSLARRLGLVEKEWAAAMLAALKARLEDWIDGGLNGSFFLQRLEKMQQELQKHLSQESEAEGRQQELASAFPYSASAAAVSGSLTSKSSPRNCLASAVAAASSEKGGAARHQAGFKSAAAAAKREPLTPCSAPPTPAGPPPTLPDDVPPASAEGARTEEATASADISRHRGGESTAATSRDGAQPPAATVITGKRSIGSAGSKKVTSSNPLVRKRMQLVERWQKSRQKDEESEEEVGLCLLHAAEE